MSGNISFRCLLVSIARSLRKYNQGSRYSLHKRLLVVLYSALEMALEMALESKPQGEIECNSLERRAGEACPNLSMLVAVVTLQAYLSG